MALITSLLDTDTYKFSMMQVVLHQYPSIPVEYAFKWRNWKEMKLSVSVEEFCNNVNNQIDHLCGLKLKEDELSFLSNVPYFKRDFIDYLRLFKLDRSHITAYVTNGELVIRIKSSWLAGILFETPVLAIVSELYTIFNTTDGFNWLLKGRERLKKKLSWLQASLHKDQEFRFADMGTRRRASFDWHGEVLEHLMQQCPNKFIGTSNVYFAKKYNIKPIGTIAHEFFQAHQQTGPRLVDSQKVALQSWANEYRGELGIALSDTLGFKAFLCDFDRYFALLFDGCRHDSGDPIQWCQNLIDHYKSLKIDPKSKQAVFSDGLNFEIAVDLFKRFNNNIQTSFGIGTYLTNDCGFIAPQVVMKLTRANNAPVAKISDSSGKGMCEDPAFLEYLKKVVSEKCNGQTNRQ